MKENRLLYVLAVAVLVLVAGVSAVCALMPKQPGETVYVPAPEPTQQFNEEQKADIEKYFELYVENYPNFKEIPRQMFRPTITSFDGKNGARVEYRYWFYLGGLPTNLYYEVVVENGKVKCTKPGMYDRLYLHFYNLGVTEKDAERYLNQMEKDLQNEIARTGAKTEDTTVRPTWKAYLEDGMAVLTLNSEAILEPTEDTPLSLIYSSTPYFDCGGDGEDPYTAHRHYFPTITVCRVKATEEDLAARVSY